LGVFLACLIELEQKKVKIPYTM